LNAMAFKEYGNYDAVGLAGLVHRKQVTALELLDEAVARTAKVDPQINAVVVKHYDYARRQIENGLPDKLLRDLRRVSVPHALFAAPASRRTQPDVTGPLAYFADPSTLYAGNFHVQHVGPAGDVGAPGLECRGTAARHDVRRALRRGGDAVSPGRPARAGTALEEQDTAGLRLNRQNSAAFEAEEEYPRQAPASSQEPA